MSYEALRHFADSYGLAAMVVLFLGLVIWVWRPSQRDKNERAANSIFDEDKSDG